MQRLATLRPVPLAMLAIGALLLQTSGTGHPDPTAWRPPELVAALERAEARRQVPYGSPGLAQRYASAKRLPPGVRIDTREAYRAAERHAAAMPLYSTGEGRLVPRADAAAARAGARELKGKWKALGPGNIGGRMRTLVIDPSDPQTIYVGGVSGGVWKTTDGGARWEPVGTDMQNIAINSMAMSPADSDVLFVGTGEGYFREDVRGTGLPLRGGGIYRTDDAGESWGFLEATAGEDFWFVNALAVSTSDADRIYAATRTGVWRSRDGGESWSHVLETDVKGGCLDLALRTDRGPDVLFASCGTFEQASVYRSENAGAGADFERVLTEPDMGRTSLALAPSNQDVIYALAASNATGEYEQALHAVFRSTSGGDAGTWEARVRNTDPDVHNTLMLHNPVFGVFSACGLGPDSYIPMGWYVNEIAVEPANPDVVWAGGVDWFRSGDGGSNWGVASYWWAGRSTPGWAHADQHVMAFHPDYDGIANQTVFIGNDGGIFRSDNARGPVANGPTGLCSPANAGILWTPLNNRLEITQFYQGLPFPDGRMLLAGAQDNGTILSLGSGTESWVPVFGGDGGYVAIDPNDTRVLYIEFQNGNVQKSTDGGASFVEARNGLPPGAGSLLDASGDFVFITPFVMDPTDSRTLWIGGKYVYRTADGAGTWSRVSKKLKKRSRVSAIAVAPSDPGTVAVGTDKGFVFINPLADKAGPSTRWPSSRPRDAWITWVAFDPDDANVLYATYGGFGGAHVFRSLDAGGSWASIDGVGDTGLPDIPVHAIVIDPDDTDRLFLATDLGVFVSTDRGGSWAQEIAGFGNIVTESMTLQREGAKRVLYAFTHGRGAWRVNVRN